MCKQNAALALANLAFNNDNMYTIVQEGAIRPLVHLLKTGNLWCKKNAGLALANLAYGATHTMAIAKEGVFEQLVRVSAQHGLNVTRCHPSFS